MLAFSGKIDGLFEIGVAIGRRYLRSEKKSAENCQSLKHPKALSEAGTFTYANCIAVGGVRRNRERY